MADVLDVDRIIRSWAVAEFMPWKIKHIDASQIIREGERLSDEFPTVFFLSVREGVLTVREKPTSITHAGIPIRLSLYVDYFTDILRSCPNIRNTHVILDVDDRPPARRHIPVFQFQRFSNTPCILLPDFEFVQKGYFEHEAYNDILDYQRKDQSAIFVGSTTGQINTVQSVENPTSARLRAAKFFINSNVVRFQLPRIVGCVDQEAEDALKHFGFGSGENISWADQFKHKFIISVDGNGATCSRVAIALRSKSILLKYDSEYSLYYMRGLIPWLDYIPVHSDDEIEPIIVSERESPGFFEYIARAGSEFAERYLTRERVIQYGREIISLYADLYHFS